MTHFVETDSFVVEKCAMLKPNSDTIMFMMGKYTGRNTC